MTKARSREAAKNEGLVLGFLLTALMAASLLTVTEPARAAATFTVNQTTDAADANPGDGACDTTSSTLGSQCTLRAAIQEANATAGADVINFNLGGGSEAKTIAPTSELPKIVDTVTIDGYTQGDATTATDDDATENTLAVGTNAVLKVELSGANAGAQATGLTIDASDSVIRGLAINRFKFDGVAICCSSDLRGNRVEGNFLGTDPSGTQDLGNGSHGVGIYGGTAIVVGGTTSGERNLISGNGRGMIVFGSGGNEVQGNLIGTQKDATTPLGNDNEGVSLVGPANLVGGTVPEAANVIAHNALDGVVVHSSLNEDRSGNRILSNSIHSNGGLGIDLGDEGETANDNKDPDTGPNNLQNHPVVTSAVLSSGTTTVKGTLNSRPRKTFTIQFFANPSGEDEGKTFLGSKTVKTNRKGKTSFSFTATGDLSGQNVTATATRNSTGDTSEFSQAVTAN